MYLVRVMKAHNQLTSSKGDYPRHSGSKGCEASEELSRIRFLDSAVMVDSGAIQ